MNTNDDGNAKEPDMPEIFSIEEGGSSIAEVSKGSFVSKSMILDLVQIILLLDKPHSFDSFL